LPSSKLDGPEAQAVNRTHARGWVLLVALGAVASIHVRNVGTTAFEIEVTSTDTRSEQVSALSGRNRIAQHSEAWLRDGLLAAVVMPQDQCAAMGARQSQVPKFHLRAELRPACRSRRRSRQAQSRQSN
jgi:hypothetical protein